MHDIVVAEHLEPVIGQQGKFKFKSARGIETQEMDINGISDRNLLKLFDNKISSLKGHVKSLTKDFN